MMPIPVLAFLHFGSVPVWAHSITATGIPTWCPYWYWHFALRFSTSLGTVHYRYWHSVVPVQVLALWHFGPVPVWAHTITGTGVLYCPYWYWHFCTSVQYRYRHSPLPELALKNGARTGTVISALWFSTSKGKVHYRYWHKTMVPVPVLAFCYFHSVSVLARDIIGTGIKKYSTDKGNLCNLVWYQQQYHYWKITIIKLLTAIQS